MSTISNLIFNEKTHKLSSPFGKRAVISTSAGNTSSFHNGCDYSTSGKKLAQYAIADGTILSCGCDTAYGGALYVWVSYPKLKVKMLHYHLDSYKVKAGQTVKKGTLLGYTGKTGKATGIHLHLGIKRLSGGDYIDPEAWSKNEYPKLVEKSVKYKVNTDVLNCRTKPSTKVGIACKFNRGTILTITDTENAEGYTWGKCSKGWVALKYCVKV